MHMHTMTNDNVDAYVRLLEASESLFLQISCQREDSSSAWPLLNVGIPVVPANHDRFVRFRNGNTGSALLAIE